MGGSRGLPGLSPARNLTPVPSPIALPPSGRGGPSWSGGAGSLCFYIITVAQQHRLRATPPQPRSPLPDGGRAMGEGTGVRFRAGESRLHGTPLAIKNPIFDTRKPPSSERPRIMRILETRVYRGPNLYALWPVIRLLIDLEELEDFPTARLPGFSDRLLEMVPSLWQHGCSYSEDGGFVRRLGEEEGTWMGHVLEHIAIELQVLAGTPVTFGKTRGEHLPKGHYHVVYSYVEEAVGLAAGDLAERIIRHILPPERADYDSSPFDYCQELEAFIELAQRRSLGP